MSQQLQKGMLGLMCIDSNEDAVLLQALKALSFLKKQTADGKNTARLDHPETDLCSIIDIFGKIKIEVKNLLGSAATQRQVNKFDKMKA